MTKTYGSSPIDAKRYPGRSGSDAPYGSGPIDAKRSPAPIVIGILLIVFGMFMTVIGIWAVVEFAVGHTGFLGLLGGAFLIPVGLLMVGIGAAVLFFGAVSRVCGGRSGRILY